MNKTEGTPRFLLTPAAIRDFRDIYQLEGLNDDQARQKLAIGAQSARLEHTKSNGSRVFSTLEPRKHYLLVSPPESGQTPSILAVARLGSSAPGHWSSPQEGDLDASTPVDLDPISCLNPGLELRFARESLGLSLEELASLLNQPLSRLQAWERGEIRSYASLRKIARAVGKLHQTRVLAYAHRFEGRTWSVPS